MEKIEIYAITDPGNDNPVIGVFFSEDEAKIFLNNYISDYMKDMIKNTDPMDAIGLLSWDDDSIKYLFEDAINTFEIKKSYLYKKEK